MGRPGGRVVYADGRRCRGEPPLRGGHFFNPCNLWDVVLTFGGLPAFGMLFEPSGSL